MRLMNKSFIQIPQKKTATTEKTATIETSSSEYSVKTNKELAQSFSKELKETNPVTTPFKLKHCSNPIGRPKGSQKQSATSFRAPKYKRKSVTNPITDLKIKRTKRTTRSGNITTTVTTVSKTTTISTIEDSEDDTLNDVDEIDSISISD